MKTSFLDRSLLWKAAMNFPKEILGEDAKFTWETYTEHQTAMLFNTERGGKLAVGLAGSTTNPEEVGRVVSFAKKKKARAMLLGLEIRDEVCAKALELGVEMINLRRETAAALIENLAPSLRVSLTRLPKRKPSKAPSITTNQILRALSKKAPDDPYGGDGNLVVYWTDPHGIARERLANRFYDKDLTLFPLSGPVYFDRYETVPEIVEEDWKGDFFPREPMHTPSEWFIARTSFEALTPERIESIRAWLRLIESLDRDEVILQLGYASGSYYSGYQEGRKKRFHEIYRIYEKPGADGRPVFDRNKLSEDLSVLDGFLLYAGNMPDLIPAGLFESFDVKVGAGSLKAEWLEYRQQQKLEGDGKEYRNDELLRDEEWLTVKLVSLDRPRIRIWDEFFGHLEGHISAYARGLRRDENSDERPMPLKRKFNPMARCPKCVALPRLLSEVSRGALTRSGKYFQHLSPRRTS